MQGATISSSFLFIPILHDEVQFLKANTENTSMRCTWHTPHLLDDAFWAIFCGLFNYSFKYAISCTVDFSTTFPALNIQSQYKTSRGRVQGSQMWERQHWGLHNGDVSALDAGMPTRVGGPYTNSNQTLNLQPMREQGLCVQCSAIFSCVHNSSGGHINNIQSHHQTLSKHHTFMAVYVNPVAHTRISEYSTIGYFWFKMKILLWPTAYRNLMHLLN